MGSARGARGYRRWAAVFVAVVVTGAACSGSADDGAEPVEDPTDPAAAVAASSAADATDVGAAPTSDDGTEPGEDEDAAAAGLGSIDALEIAGEIINKFNLTDGECFNRLEGLQSGRKVEITSRVECDQPHRAEVFHEFDLDVEHPGIYPGDDAMRRYALRICYEQFEAFVGESYELSAYEIGVFTPDRTNFEHEVARYRGVHCWLYDATDEPLVGTARGTAR